VSAPLPAVAPRKAIRALERCGWQLDRVKGQPSCVSPPGSPSSSRRAVHGRDLAKGTLGQIIAASGVSREDFIRLL
jgi:predicted RNA binding protein YcfA (HicA-like mRNA interferase family)